MVKRVVILVGAFFALGNINPSAEANIYGDPKAADIVFTSGANIDIVGINITTQVKMPDADLDERKQSKGKYARFLWDSSKFYRNWHVKSDGVYDMSTTNPTQTANPSPMMGSQGFSMETSGSASSFAKKKRGRPRKYDPYWIAVSEGRTLSPMPLHASSITSTSYSDSKLGEPAGSGGEF